MSISQSTHKQALIDILTDEIRESASVEGLTIANAATRVLIKWLGYESDEMFFLDGDDRGIDAWLATESGFDIFQIKTHDLTDNDLIDLSCILEKGLE